MYAPSAGSVWGSAEVEDVCGSAGGCLVSLHMLRSNVFVCAMLICGRSCQGSERVLNIYVSVEK